MHKTFFTVWNSITFDLRAATALSTHAQNVFFTVWMARWDLVTFDLRAATALSTHAQNASYKLIVEIVWEEKVRRRREKMKYKS